MKTNNPSMPQKKTSVIKDKLISKDFKMKDFKIKEVSELMAKMTFKQLAHQLAHRDPSSFCWNRCTINTRRFICTDTTNAIKTNPLFIQLFDNDHVNSQDGGASMMNARQADEEVENQVVTLSHDGGASMMNARQADEEVENQVVTLSNTAQNKTSSNNQSTPSLFRFNSDKKQIITLAEYRLRSSSRVQSNDIPGNGGQYEQVLQSSSYHCNSDVSIQDGGGSMMTAGQVDEAVKNQVVTLRNTAQNKTSSHPRIVSVSRFKSYSATEITSFNMRQHGLSVSSMDSLEHGNNMNKC